MNFIRKITENKTDEWVKKVFKRYGKGIYEAKAIVEINKGAKSNTIKTSFEFAEEMAYNLADSIKGKTRVTGGMITTQKIRDEIPVPVTGEKQFAGVRTFLLDSEMSKEDVKGLFEKYPEVLILLSFKTEVGELKSKVKSPTSSKPGSGKKEPKADFCTFKTQDMSIVEDYAFDVKDFKKVKIIHTFQIDDLEVPKGYENDFKMARLNAIRKGKLIREIIIDDNKEVKEYPLKV
ncbi:MAG: hypothetical protein Q8Q35_03440 [Nanoarchaeota archaeon]|nr:hypothetical protein [Nanoarchaeota archaeon]